MIQRSADRCFVYNGCMDFLQIICIGIIGGIAGSIASPVGTTWGNYVLGRPLIASFLIGLIVGDVPGVMAMGIPVQLMWMMLVTPGGVVPVDLRCASYGGITAAWLAVHYGGCPYPASAAVIAALCFGYAGTKLFSLEVRINGYFERKALEALDAGNTRRLLYTNILGPLLSHVLVSGMILSAAILLFSRIYIAVLAVIGSTAAFRFIGCGIPLWGLAQMSHALSEDVRWLSAAALGLILGFAGLPLPAAAGITVLLMIFASRRTQSEETEEEI